MASLLSGYSRDHERPYVISDSCNRIRRTTKVLLSIATSFDSLFDAIINVSFRHELLVHGLPGHTLGTSPAERGYGPSLGRIPRSCSWRLCLWHDHLGWLHHWGVTVPLVRPRHQRREHVDGHREDDGGVLLHRDLRQRLQVA